MSDSLFEMYKRDTQTRLLKGVYFAYCHLAGRIKIGHTINLEQRFTMLNTAAPGPLTLLGFIYTDNYKEEEAHIHSRFSRFYSGHGEWFYARKELLDFIKDESEQVDVSKFKYRQRETAN